MEGEKTLVVIKSLDELLVHMGAVLAGEASWDIVDLDKLSVVVPVVVEGNTWDARIDVRGAALIQNLQKQVNSTYAMMMDESLPHSVMVKATTKEGSNWLNIDFTEVIKAGIEKMDSKDILKFLGLCVFCGTAAYSFNTYQSGLTDRSSLEALERANQNIRDVAVAVITEGKEPSLPMHRYLKTLRRGDEVSIAGSDFMPKREAVNKIERPAKDDTLFFTQCDGEYDLISINVRGELPELHIVQDGVSGKALFFARVPEAVKNEIIATLDKRISGIDGQAAPAPTMHLQLDGYFTGKGPQYFVIHGIGSPRSGKNYMIKELPSGVQGSDKQIPGLGK